MTDDFTLDVLEHLVSRLEARWLPPDLPDQDVYWAYGPLYLGTFWWGLNAVSEMTTGRRFFDVGCGIGRQMLIAYFAGWTVAGVERYLPYVEAARSLLPDGVEVIHADIFDVTSFEADVVYMYRPAVEDELERTLINHVGNHAESGCLLWLPEGDQGLGLGSQISPTVWRL